MRRFTIILMIMLILLSGCRSREDAASEAIKSNPASSEGVSSVSQPPEESEDTPEDLSVSTVPQSGEENPTSAIPAPKILTLSIPEGYTLARIGMVLEDMEVCTTDEFIAAAQDGDFDSFPLVAAQNPSQERCFRLEGYLFPATYEIYSTDTPDAIIRKILDHTETMISADLRSRIDASGYTIDEILTLASIIEKEAFGHGQMAGISSVLHNRLDAGMQLQCDVTITYVTGAIHPFISGDKDRYNSFYNTYKCKALPAGAICNPGMDAILAALAPAETDYFYFVTDADKNYLYAETGEEHLVNVEKAGIGEASQ